MKYNFELYGIQWECGKFFYQELTKIIFWIFWERLCVFSPISLSNPPQVGGLSMLNFSRIRSIWIIGINKDSMIHMILLCVLMHHVFIHTLYFSISHLALLSKRGTKGEGVIMNSILVEKYFGRFNNFLIDYVLDWSGLYTMITIIFYGLYRVSWHCCDCIWQLFVIVRSFFLY